MNYNANNPGSLGTAVLELDTSGFSHITGANDVRISSFANVSNILYATVGNQIWQRTNGASPSWSLLLTDTGYVSSQTGLTGLAGVDNSPSSTFLWVGREGVNAAAMTILLTEFGTPITPAFSTVYSTSNVQTILSTLYGETVTLGYSKVFYTPMFEFTSENGQTLIGGWSSTITSATANTPVVYCAAAAANVYAYPMYITDNYQVSSPIHFNQLQPLSQQNMVAVRSFAFPFAVGGDIWFSGFDTFGNTNHNTAWVAKTGTAVINKHFLA